ncbi:ferritin-like domain-containing protein [Nocardia sp. NBC_01329]|uniref:ferritin-like domain-containing protein n=1 Tax=Nocardia sp. NBC_01329 TaxID=2903594 RepID=UPI002E12D343|nr:ferritin-like domain-containing protein [Nocardia sp. NBC_01329]
MSGAEQQALRGALDAEYAAIYAYGVIAAHTSPERRRTVNEHTAAHRARRDATADLLTAGGADAPPAEPAYTVPIEVIDPASAAQLAIVVETDTAVAWRAVVESAATETTRRTGVEALTESAGRRAVWQTAAGIAPATVAFPGRP